LKKPLAGGTSSTALKGVAPEPLAGVATAGRPELTEFGILCCGGNVGIALKGVAPEPLATAGMPELAL
jgi:hypothetical protein